MASRLCDLSKPCDFYWYWFSREAGRDVYYLLFRFLPTYTGGMVLFGIGLPGDWGNWLGYAVALLLGAMIGIAYRFLYNIVAFWILEARSVAVLAGTIGLFFTGSFVPLPFFPKWLHTLADWLPFNGLMNLPAEIFLGKLSGSLLWFELSRQVFWLIVLTLIVRMVTAVATRRVIVQGG